MSKKERIMSVMLPVYLLCFIFRIFEYIMLRTDQTFLGEAFIHKLIGITVFLAGMKLCGLNLKDMGFLKDTYNLLKGLAFGLIIFAFAYLVEIMITVINGNFKAINVYVSAYAIDGNVGNRTAAIFFIICILGNIINVVMEEGVFRGFFQKQLEMKYSFFIAALIASCMFGLWHIVAPIRNYYDGTISIGGFIANAIMLVVTSALVGFKYAMMTKLTGSLCMAMGDHFVNNTMVNLVHVLSDTGADELMVIRISIAQSVSCIIVLIWYIVSKRKKNML